MREGRRMRRAVAYVPLALLVGALLAGLGSPPHPEPRDMTAALPDGQELPSQAIDEPASLSDRRVGASESDTGDAEQAVDTASSGTIPEVALAAYQRAQAVINESYEDCRIPWELIAAIGRVESDHGRHGNSSLGADGVADPPIIGIPLDGKQDTVAIPDTDGGEYDQDTTWDRAVGPMQFIPSTWAVVGVDGDADGLRDPQDIDDAALATAVYLCSAEDDLSNEQGQRAAIYRYNHSRDYVELVLTIMAIYQRGDYDTPLGLPVATGLPEPGPVATEESGPGKGGKNKGGDKDGDKGGKPKPTPAPTPTPTSPTKTPTPSPTSSPTPSPTSTPTPTPTPAPTTTTLPTPTTTLNPQPMTWAQAVQQCRAQGVVDNPGTPVNEVAQCASALLTP